MNKQGNGARVLVILASTGLTALIFIGFYIAMGNIPSLSQAEKIEIGAEINDLSNAGQLRLILAQIADDIAKEDYSKVSTFVGQVFGSDAEYSLSINKNRVAGTSVSGDIVRLETSLPRYDQEILLVKFEVAP